MSLLSLEVLNNYLRVHSAVDFGWTLEEVFCTIFEVSIPREFLKADPAVLILALCTSHVVAAIMFVARNATVWTELAIVSLFPLHELFIVRAALFARMSSFSTLKTDTLTTFARYRLLEHACLFDKAVAACPRTPLEIRVQIDVDVHLELKELLIDFLGAKLPHIVVCESD